MRNELITDELGIPVNNKIIVNVTDTFNSFMSAGGIELVNAVADDAWSDSYGYNITEFIIRYGIVVRVPNAIYSGDYDYETENEVACGDLVWWNSISFSNHTPLVCKGQKYLLVDYHELLMVKRGSEVFPINGNVLLLPVKKEEKFLEFVKKYNKTTLWEIFGKSVKVKELNPDNEFEDIWEIGDIVHTMVYDSPFQIEGDINRSLDLELYACPTRMILCSANLLSG